jgi:hypothetical protein
VDDTAAKSNLSGGLMVKKYRSRFFVFSTIVCPKIDRTPNITSSVKAVLTSTLLKICPFSLDSRFRRGVAFSVFSPDGFGLMVQAPQSFD